jgi:threonine aldolase
MLLRMIVDLRSDTVTRPTPAMREAMARAEVGDDVYGEDPTVNRLQDQVAALLGKEAALFVPSGVMANQIALAVLTRPGDEVLVSRGAHCMYYESGAGAALAGVQFRELGGDDGLFDVAEVERSINPDNAHYPVTTVVAIENSHNRGGGRVVPQARVQSIAAAAKKRGLSMHLDGARLFNVGVATSTPMRELAAPFDTVSICLSKGLGAPVGSLILGSTTLIARAHRRRKMLGGGMRQAGILAAAAIYALEHNIERMKDDHANARAFAEVVARAPGVILDLTTVETNIVVFDLKPEVPLDAAQVVTRAKDKGVLLNPMGARRVRAVTHLDVDRAACVAGAERVLELLKSA